MLEKKIQDQVRDYLEARGWLVERLIGNAFQTGLTDLLCWHPKWGLRMVDIKREGRYRYTKAQIKKWPLWERYNLGVWILTAATQQQYNRLFKPPNFRDYWKDSYGELPDVDEILDEISDL